MARPRLSLEAAIAHFAYNDHHPILVLHPDHRWTMHPKSQKNLKVVVDGWKELRIEEAHFEQQVTGAESHDKSHHILSQKFIGRTSKLSLWAKIVGHLNHSRWW